MDKKLNKDIRNNEISNIMSKKLTRREALTRVAKIGIAVGAAAIVAGVGSYLYVTRAPPVEKKIVVPHPSGWESWAPGLRLIPKFEEETGIKVDLRLMPWGEFDRKQVMEAVSETGVYDVYTCYDAAAWAEARPHMMILDDYIKETFGSIKAFEDNLLSPDYKWSLMYEGHYIYVPIHANEQFLVYRRNLFEDPENKRKFKEEYGRELTVPKTLEELHEVALFFNNPPTLYGYTTNAGYPDWWITHVFHDSGGKYYDEDLKFVPAHDRTQRDLLRKVMEWLYDGLHKHKYINLDSLKALTGDVYDFFVAGNAAMAFGWFGDYWGREKPGLHAPTYRERLGPVDATLMPSIDGKHRGSGFGGVWVHGIPKGVKNPDWSWEYIKWAIGEEAQMACAGGQIPPFKDIAEKAAKTPLPFAPDKMLVDPAWLKAESLSHFYHKARGKLWPEAADAINFKFRELLKAYYAGEIDVDDVIDKYNEFWEGKKAELGIP
jgi:ABC-type glycerol-3-phosphate transport system substrate-binding protein